MRLCSIINVWVDCLCLLPFCIKNHLQFCDGIIVVWSSTSNHGVKDDRMLEFVSSQLKPPYEVGRVIYERREPIKDKSPLVNETMKRNEGIDVARTKGYTHFLIADADEMYIPSEMNEEKKRFDNPKLNGLVHPLRVYIKSPTLFCGDHTLVPGIQKMSSDIKVGPWMKYPFVYDSEDKAHIDPSRRPYYSDGVEMSDVFMHHYSYIRKDIDLKINNSSAKLHRSRQVIYDELRDAKPGHVSRLYHQPLQSCENFFNIEI